VNIGDAAANLNPAWWLVEAGPGQSRRSTPKNEPPAAARDYLTAV
jgi:hypothetical protein